MVNVAEEPSEFLAEKIMNSDVSSIEVDAPDSSGEATVGVLDKDSYSHMKGEALFSKDPDEDSGLSNCTQSLNTHVSSVDGLLCESARNSDAQSPEESEKPSSMSGWLFRLFESEMFDAHLAIVYLFRNRDNSVRNYVTTKLFQLNERAVFFYLPQLIAMYVRYDAALSEALHIYLAHRCAESAETAVCTAWLVDAYSAYPNFSQPVEGDKLRPVDSEKQRPDPKTRATDRRPDRGEERAQGDAAPSANRLRAQQLRNAIVNDQLRFIAGPSCIVSSVRVDSSASSTDDSNATETQPHAGRCGRKHKRTTSDMSLSTMQQLAAGQGAHGTGPCDRTIRKVRPGKPHGLAGRHAAARSPSIASLVSVTSLQFELSVGRAFETGCVCPWRHANGLGGLGYAFSSSNLSSAAHIECVCTCGSGGRRIQAELRFVHSLMQIGKRLKRLRTRDERTAQLRAELAQINQNLPARIWLPTVLQSHVVLRIPNQVAVVLNSKERAPFMIFVEIAQCTGDPFDEALPLKDTRLNDRHAQNADANWDRMSTNSYTLSAQIPSLNGTITAAQFSEAAAEERLGEQPGANGSSQLTILRNNKQPDTVSISTFDSVCEAEEHDDEAPANESDSVSASDELRTATSRELPRSAVHVSTSAHAGLNKPQPDATYSEQSSLRHDGVDSERTSMRKLGLGCESERSSVAQFNFDGEREMFVSAAAIRKRLTDSAEQESKTRFERDPDDPSASVLKEPFREKCVRIRAKSPYGYLPNWRLVSVIVKCGDDLRQELLAYQFMTCLAEIWNELHIPLWLKPVRIVVVGPDCGFVEPIQNAVSIHQIKKAARTRLNGPQVQVPQASSTSTAGLTNGTPNATGSAAPSGRLLDYFIEQFGGATSEQFLAAQRNFVESCAAYCIVSYLLQVKDRHNGNILVDDEGHLIHIDFGFVLSTSPGRNFGFEMSAFKLTAEYLEVMGGPDSDMFAYFKLLILKGLLACRKHADRLSALVEIMMECGVELPCFRKFERTKPSSNVAAQLRSRFHLNLTEEHLHKLVEKLVAGSLNSYSTRLYDTYQYFTNGILS